jgi:uncharacterized membrane protein YesL
MKDAFRIIRSALGDIWNHLPLVIAGSLTWLVLAVLIIPGPPATLALFDMAERMVRREHLLGYRDYLAAVRARFGVGWRWAAVSGPVLALLLIDILVAPQMFSPDVAMPLQMFFIGALALWIVINWYALAFLFQQQELSVRQALRNGAILLLQHPLFTLVLALATALLLWLGMILILVNLFFGPMLVALIGTHAVFNWLEPIRAASRTNRMHEL